MVRSFTVLDGIGKSLSPRFDMTEIAAPYARNLILEARPQLEKLQQEIGKRFQRQVGGMCRGALLMSTCIGWSWLHLRRVSADALPIW